MQRTMGQTHERYAREDVTKERKEQKKNIQSNFVVHVLRCWLGSGRAVLREARGGLSARAACRQLRREGCQRIQVRARDQ